MTIKRKISLGYVLVMGLAFGGTGTALVIGNHYQQQALVLRQEATADRRLLSELQVKILYNRPTKQLSPYLDDPVAFQQQSDAFLERLKNIQVTLAEHGDSETHQAYLQDHLTDRDRLSHHLHENALVQRSYHQLHTLLIDYEATVQVFIARFEAFIQATSPLTTSSRDLIQARELLVALASSPEFAAFVEFSDQLEPFYIEVTQLEQQAEAALAAAEKFRNRIILISLGLSGTMAAAIALFTSRTVARPLELATRVARQVAKEENFDLEVPVVSRDETGILANVLNKLIRQVKALLVRLEEKNTDLQVALDSLNQQQVQLIQAEKMSSLGQLVAGVAHEINNPVNFIHGNLTHVKTYTQDLLDYLDVLEAHIPPDQPDVEALSEDIELDFLREDLAKTLNSMENGTQRIRQLVLSLRNFSRLDEADSKAVDLHEGLESALVILHHRLKQTTDRTAIQVIKDYGALPPIQCYPSQLNQVFINILANAIDALEEREVRQCQAGGPITPKQIILRTRRCEHDWVEVAIADNGPGIPIEVQAKILDPFFTTKPMGKGTGLGMSISHQIVTENHGGQLKFTSSPEQGTEFCILIPIHQTASQTVKTEANVLMTRV